jgi:hypothetical protein
VAGIYLRFEGVDGAQAAIAEIAERNDFKYAGIAIRDPDGGVLVEVFTAETLTEGTIGPLMGTLQEIARRRGGDISAWESDDR